MSKIAALGSPAGRGLADAADLSGAGCAAASQAPIGRSRPAGESPQVIFRHPSKELAGRARPDCRATSVLQEDT